MGYQLTNLPTTGQKAALTGTSGTPSASNTFVTFSDTFVHGSPFRGFGEVSLGLDMLVSSTSLVQLMQLNLGLVANQSVNALIMVNAAVETGINNLTGIQVWDETNTPLQVGGIAASPWLNVMAGSANEMNLIFTQFIPANTSKTYKLMANINSGGQLVNFKAWTILGACW